MKISKQSGMSLVETLAAIVIGCISVTAVFYSYQFFSRSYTGIVEKAAISKGGRDALSMIARDLRNAGYRDVNYTKAIWDRWIDMTSNYLGTDADSLTIWYNTSANDRVRIRYHLKKYQNSKAMFLARDLDENPVTSPLSVYDDEVIVPYVTDFQVVLKDIEGKELKPVCVNCVGVELTQGTKAEGNANQSKAHTAEIYLTVRSPNEVYKKDRTSVIFNGDNITTGREQTIKDRYHRETFFVSTYLRNIAKN